MANAKLWTAGAYPAARLSKTVYIVNIVPVFAVAINVYAVNSMINETRAVLRSRRGEVASLFSAFAVVFPPADEACVSVVSFA